MFLNVSDTKTGGTVKLGMKRQGTGVHQLQFLVQ